MVGSFEDVVGRAVGVWGWPCEDGDEDLDEEVGLVGSACPPMGMRSCLWFCAIQEIGRSLDIPSDQSPHCLSKNVIPSDS
jgi:hypothetical protein